MDQEPLIRSNVDAGTGSLTSRTTRNPSDWLVMPQKMQTSFVAVCSGCLGVGIDAVAEGQDAGLLDVPRFGFKRSSAESRSFPVRRVPFPSDSRDAA